MVVHKVVEIQISHVLKIFHCMSNFKIVMVIVTTIECFVKCIVRYTVKCLSVYPAAVITMDNFTHKPEVFFYFCCCAAKCTHEIEIKHICRIQTDSVDIKFGYPETDYIADIILNFRISLI